MRPRSISAKRFDSPSARSRRRIRTPVSTPADWWQGGWAGSLNQPHGTADHRARRQQPTRGRCLPADEAHAQGQLLLPVAALQLRHPQHGREHIRRRWRTCRPCVRMAPKSRSPDLSKPLGHSSTLERFTASFITVPASSCGSISESPPPRCQWQIALPIAPPHRVGSRHVSCEM
jgi:hypothetical protein